MTVDPVLLIAIPLVSAFLTPLISLLSRKASRWVPLLGVIGMAGVMALLFGDLYDGAVTSTTGGFDPPYGISIVMTPLGGIISTGMILVALFVILSDLGGGRKFRVVYDTMVMMGTAGAVGMVITGDIFNMFVFLEITSIAGVVLAAIPREGEEKGLNWRGAASYAIMGTVASFVVLAGIGLLYSATSTLNIARMVERIGEVDPFVLGTAFMAMFVGLGIEAELFPLNGWAPEVYKGSRWGTSSLFSGVIGKAGLIALVRIVFTVIGPAVEGGMASEILLWTGVITFLFGEAAAFTSKDVNRMLGYSSVGVFGLLAASFSLGSGEGIRAAVLQIIGHMLAKPLLFSVMGHIGIKGDAPLSSLKGLSGSSPTAAALLTVGALALIGMPPSPNFWGKFFFFTGAGDRWLVIGLVVIGTLMEAGYVARLLYNVHSRKGDEDRKPISVARGITGVFAALLIVSLGLFPGLLEGILDLVVSELTDPSIYSGWGVF